MEKPNIITETIHYYHYIACRDYIKEKYKFTDHQIRNFWNQWIMEYHDITNGKFFDMSTSNRPTNEFYDSVFDALVTEFGNGEPFIKFHVSW